MRGSGWPSAERRRSTINGRRTAPTSWRHRQRASLNQRHSTGLRPLRRAGYQPCRRTPSSNATLVVRVPQHLTAALRPSGGEFALTFGDADGGLLTAGDLAGFEVLASTNLLSWVTLTNALALTNGQALLIDTSCTNLPERFYRVIEH